MRKLLFTIAIMGVSLCAMAQAQPALIDSLKLQIARAKNDREKFDLTGHLSKVLMNTNPAEADIYGRKLIEIAENSRDRQMMVEAQLLNGERYSFLAGRRDNIEKSKTFYNRGLEIARENKLDELIVRSYLALSELSRYSSEHEKALNYTNQANSYGVILKDDSINARVHLEYGLVYMLRNEKLLALRNFLAAVRISEELKNNSLTRSAYQRLSGFYATIEDYDRSIDYQVRSIQLIGQMTGPAPYQKVQELNRVGDLFSFKKDDEMAFHYYEKALALADSLRYEPLKSISYRSIINNYLNSNQPRKALDYYNSHPQLREFLEKVNFGHFVDQSYGYIYTMLGQYDSAKLHYGRIAEFFEKEANPNNLFSYYYQLGILYSKTGEIDKSLASFQRAKSVADQIGNLDQMKTVVSMLDSIYQRKGDYKQAMSYASLHLKYKDSLDKLGREKDLMQVEAADEQQRQARLEKELLEKKRRRNNIQYMAITFGIVGLFIALVVLGMFKVSAGTIKAIGFFAFLLFFEFIFMLFKKNIYSITHGEPWKDLAFILALAAMLVPLHHWLEKRVLNYLTSHNRLTRAGAGIKQRIFNRSGSQDQ